MNEVGVDISDHTPKNVVQYLNEEWDYVITVCDDANETCPVSREKSDTACIWDLKIFKNQRIVYGNNECVL